jgi:DNA-binding transcriptional MerR regulator
MSYYYVMNIEAFGVSDLAAAAGVSARAVRFYVQRGLLPAPAGLGRGKHYSQRHLRRLIQILHLQRLGHTLAAIREMPEPVDALPERVEAAVVSGGRPSVRVEAVMVTRVTLLPGVAVEFEAGKFHPSPEGIQVMRELAWEVFAGR